MLKRILIILFQRKLVILNTIIIHNQIINHFYMIVTYINILHLLTIHQCT